MKLYWRLRLANGPLWRRCVVLSRGAIAAWNLRCAATGMRSYVLAVNVRSRTPQEQ